ncbi:DEAD/DEAH box helicase [Selenomonas bovis]|uniref:DEAD/DEAH box helicase n=1 Tax=Selenomonas bovis TaxID=416586 RepID=A0A848B797_9FIRM|nr:DEAD/DEAH box helicase [Selenomonas bovis]NMD99346.1 DEAD/DEAH box helicase [Selenomonas bovis]
MKYTPHAYQRYAAQFILDHPAAAIFLDCGLGKTVITLTAIRELLHDSFAVRRVLIIAPLRVARDTWPSEIRKWDHLSDLTYAVAVGNTAKRLAALRQKAEITIINRENVDWLVKNNTFDFDMIIIDELSAFKSHRTRRFKALMKVRPMVSRIVGLTGTPSSNGLMDLWAEFRLLDMGKRLGRFLTHYRERYFLPDKRNAQMVFTYKPRPGAEEKIYEAIGDITISMKSGDYLELPKCLTNVVRVEMNERERRIYERLKKDMAAEIAGKEIDAMNAAALSGKLLQMAAGAVYDGEGQAVRLHDRKLDALEDLVESANGRPVLIAYWFRHDLERIRKRFPGARELRQEADIADWNAGKISIGLIHPASAGHGLNLQDGGSMLIWFSLTWSLELNQQTNARLWRQGQKHTVTIHYLVMKDSIDESVMAALSRKDKVQEALMAAVKAELGKE